MITDGVVGLRLFEASDLPWIHALCWQPHVQPMLFWDAARPLLGDVATSLLHTASGTESLGFIIVRAEQPVGFTTVNNIEPVHRKAHLAYTAMERKVPGDTAYRAGKLLLKYCFNTLNLNRVDMKTFTGNKPVTMLYRRLGFILEGVQRQAAWRDGRFRDFLHYALLREEYHGCG